MSMELNKALDLLRGLVSEVEHKTCCHEETHRGGAIWEICDSCGAKWADDEGGKPEFAWPESVEKARAFLATHHAVEQADASSCQGTNCGTTTGDHSSECLAEAAAGQGWELKPGDLCGRDCPIHKISVEQAGGDERDFQAGGAQEVPSPVSQEYDRHLISILRKGEALPGHQEEAADEIERLRDWNDHLNNTVLPNILNPNFLMLMKGGERLLDLCTKDGKFIGVSLNDMKDVFDWMVTHARIAPDHAALAQPSPASDLDPFNLAPHAEAFNEAPDEALKPEQAEAERPEVVGSLYLGCWADQEELEDNDVELDMKVVERLQVDLASKGDGVHMPLMTVAQHERIVGELRTEIAMLRSYESEWELLLNQHEQERDSALAEVERLRQFERICEGLPQDAIDGCWTVQGIRGYAKLLEDQLKSALARVAELEKQEPVATVAKVPGEDWNGLHFYRDLQGMLPGTKLYTTPVAQAQHSVPDGAADLCRFLAKLYCELDGLRYSTAKLPAEQIADALIFKWPVLQGARNQLNIKRISEQPYDESKLHSAIAAMLAAAPAQGGE